jgi:hypothetical protein
MRLGTIAANVVVVAVVLVGRRRRGRRALGTIADDAGRARRKEEDDDDDARVRRRGARHADDDDSRRADDAAMIETTVDERQRWRMVIGRGRRCLSMLGRGIDGAGDEVGRISPFLSSTTPDIFYDVSLLGNRQTRST